MSKLERMIGNVLVGFGLLFNSQAAQAIDKIETMGFIVIKDLRTEKSDLYFDYVKARLNHLRFLKVIDNSKLDNDSKIKIKNTILKSYEDILEKDQKSSHLLGEIGIVLMDFDDYEKAEGYLTNALELDSMNRAAYENLKQLYHITKQPDKIESLEAGYGYRFIKDEKNINKK